MKIGCSEKEGVFNEKCICPECPTTIKKKAAR